jgi:hypothetical protein
MVVGSDGLRMPILLTFVVMAQYAKSNVMVPPVELASGVAMFSLCMMITFPTSGFASSGLPLPSAPVGLRVSNNLGYPFGEYPPVDVTMNP